MCSKKAYRKKINALLALVSCQIKAKEDFKRREKRVYKCPHCSKWHLTSKDQKVVEQ